MTDNQVDSIEEVARRYQAGADTLENLMDVFAHRIVFVPSATDPREDFCPILSKVDDTEYVDVGATPESLSRLHGMMHFVMTMSGGQVLAGVHPDVGVMVLIEHGSFTIEPWLAAELRAKYGIQSLAPGSSS